MAQIDFDDTCCTQVGRLVATVPNQPSTWDSEKTTRVLADFFQDGFFFLCLPSELRNKLYKERPKVAARLAKICSDLRMEDKNRIKQETISKVLLGREPVTLEHIVALDRMLNKVATEGSEAQKREISLSNDGGPGTTVLQLPNNSVMPSLYAVNREQFESLFRRTGANDTAAASTQVFANGVNPSPDYFRAVLRPPFVEVGAKKRRKTCRISKPTVAHLYGQITAYLDGDAEKAIAYFRDDRLGGFTGGPNYSFALSPESGNLMQLQPAP